MKECHECGVDLSNIRGKRFFCAKCRQDRLVRWRHEYREKVQEGHISKLDKFFILKDYGNKCSHCGTKERIEMHHKRYGSQPIIVPLCMKCHKQEHKLLKKIC